jgi:hypothetical protein
MKTTDIPLSTFAPPESDVDLGVDAGSNPVHRIVNLKDPQDPADAATKAYVDAATDPVRPVSSVSSQTTLADAQVLRGLVLIGDAVEVTLPDAGQDNAGADLYASADDTASLVCDDGFHGMGTGYTTLTFAAGEGCHVYSDGTSWYLLGCGPGCALS